MALIDGIIMCLLFERRKNNTLRAFTMLVYHYRAKPGNTHWSLKALSAKMLNLCLVKAISEDMLFTLLYMATMVAMPLQLIA